MTSDSDMKMQEKAQIPEFYANKTILITGATGFVGQVLIWKLLQSCPLINTIYILIRFKHEKDVSTRRRKLLSSPIFNNFQENNPQLLEKVVAISGDVGEPDLGLSDWDRARLIDEVSIIFHSAAMLKMNASLKSAINVNTEGVLRMMDIAQQMKNLSVFVYVSTAYCCCNEKVVKEQLYPIGINPRGLINAVHSLPSEILDKITQELISPLPNTYIYSKRLAEILIAEYETNIPSVVIARPTIVASGYKEPISGWLDSLNGFFGISVAGGTGILRTVYTVPQMKANFIPVDLVSNSLIAIPWMEVRKKKFSQISVYNLAEVESNISTWKELLNVCYDSIMKFPLEIILWYPSPNLLEPNLILFKIKAFFFHWIPAYIIDFILFAVGRKKIMIRIHKKISNGMQLFSYFTNQEWEFHTNNLALLRNSMNSVDADLFPFNLPNRKETIKIVENTIFIIKKYILKESPNNLQKCRRHLLLLYILKIAVDAIVYFIIINIILNFVIKSEYVQW